MKQRLLVVAGPTASGKTSLAIQMAQYYNTIILSGDARQFYQEMSIGTAKPTPEELGAAPHYLVDQLSIHDAYSVGDFERDALALLQAHYQTHEYAILVGGSGLYIKALCEGLDNYPTVPAEVREALNAVWQTQGIEALQQELAKSDPIYYTQVDRQNPHRLIRALEICRHTGKPFSSFQNQIKPLRPFQTTTLAINWDRPTLYARINQRVDQMIQAGLVEEARGLYPHRALNALQTVGYQELFAHFDGTIDLATAIELIKRNSRRYAKRQLTWLRKDASIHWVEPGTALEEIVALVEAVG